MKIAVMSGLNVHAQASAVLLGKNHSTPTAGTRIATITQLMTRVAGRTRSELTTALLVPIRAEVAVHGRAGRADHGADGQLQRGAAGAARSPWREPNRAAPAADRARGAAPRPAWTRNGPGWSWADGTAGP